VARPSSWPPILKVGRTRGLPASPTRCVCSRCCGTTAAAKKSGSGAPIAIGTQTTMSQRLCRATAGLLCAPQAPLAGGGFYAATAATTMRDDSRPSIRACASRADVTILPQGQGVDQALPVGPTTGTHESPRPEAEDRPAVADDSLLDVLKETDVARGLTQCVSAAHSLGKFGSRDPPIPPAVDVVWAGTGAGLKAVHMGNRGGV